MNQRCRAVGLLCGAKQSPIFPCNRGTPQGGFDFSYLCLAPEIYIRVERACILNMANEKVEKNEKDIVDYFCGACPVCARPVSS